MPKNGVSFLPNDPVVREKWIKAVKAMRKYWKGPTVHTVVCSNHFLVEDYSLTSRTKKKLGIKTNMLLEKWAVPTVFLQPYLEYQTPGRKSLQTLPDKIQLQGVYYLPHILYG